MENFSHAGHLLLTVRPGPLSNILSSQRALVMARLATFTLRALRIIVAMSRSIFVSAQAL